MQDIVFGIVTILVGTYLCFRGQGVLRLVISVWGAFAGFGLGAGLVSSFSDERFLGTALGWVLGFVFALLFAVFAYLYYAVGVVIAMATIGFALGATLIVALGVDWSWVIVLVGIAAGALLAALAIGTNLPMLLLILLSALGGASVTVAGVMLLFGVVDSANFNDRTYASQIRDDWWWYLLFVGLAIAGTFFQSRDAATRRNMRDSWS